MSKYLTLLLLPLPEVCALKNFSAIAGDLEGGPIR
jgi:hypothetical protein